MSGLVKKSKINKDLVVLAKYFRYECRYDDGDVINHLQKWLTDIEGVKKDNLDRWQQSIEWSLDVCGNHPYRNIETVEFSQSELEYIKNVEDMNYRQVLFTIMCFDKVIPHEVNGKRWIVGSIPDIFTYANVSNTSKNYRYTILRKLDEFGYIGFSNKVNDLGLYLIPNQITYEGKKYKFKVDETLGIQYRNMYSVQREKNLCKCCGKKFKPQFPNSKYCSDDCKKKMISLKNARYQHNKSDDLT